MQSYFHQYREKQKAALDSVPLPAVEQIVEKFREALTADRQLFMMGNGGNASNASHFVTDLGKGASDKTVKRSEEHTSELQSLMRISYAVFCLKKKNKNRQDITQQHTRSTSSQQ